MRVSYPFFRTEALSALRADALIITLVIHTLGLALPLSLLQIYDRILPGQSYGTTTILVIGVAIAISLDAFLRYGRSKLFIDAGAKYESEMLVSLFARLLNSDIRQIEEHGAHHITDTTRSISKIKDLLSGQTIISLYEVPFVFVYIGLIAYIAGWLAWIPTILFAITLAITLSVKSKIEADDRLTSELESERSKLSWSIGLGMNYFKAMAAEPDISRKFSSVNQKYLSSNSELETKNSFLNENASLISQLSTVLIVVFGAQEVISGNLTTGALAAATLLSGRSIAPCMAGIGLITRIAQLKGEMKKITELANLPSVMDGADSEKVEELGEQLLLTLRGKLIPNNTIEIKQGQVVHFTGRNSSMVSYLLGDIAGLGVRTSTEIILNGHNIQSINSHTYREHVMYVPRTTTLLPGSILNNLTLFDPRYNESARDYASKLGLTPLLNKMKNGILTEVGQASLDILDQGVYQRIAIIRALVREPSILLLDNAASGIDIDGLKRLASVIEELRGRTTILLSTSKSELIKVCSDTIELVEEQ